ncbi:MAG: prolyl oligopeptidase family serine peptidase [Gemmatimonadaceae bacterium]|nr:prolyl oligopeptidase family serine peptidase [Gemmatimonadaceae bacterium]
MRRLLAVTWFSCALAAPAAAQSRPAIAPADYGKWETPGPASLSPDGRWIAYTVQRVDEQVEVRVRRLDRDSTLVIANASAPVFNADSRWLAYTVSPTPAERERLERDRKPVRTSTGLLELGTLARHALAQSSSHRFSADGRHLAVRLVPTDAAKRDAADLLVRDLAAGTSQTIGNVASYAWSDRGAQLALALETDGQAGNGVQLLDAGNGRLRTLASSTDRYRGLAWRRGAMDLAVLRSQPTNGYRDSTNVVLAWRGVGSASERRFTLDPAGGRGVLATLRVAEQRKPEWRRDGRGLAIGLRPRLVTADTASPREKASDVQVWHARDVRPIPMQKVQEQADLRRTFYSVWWLDDDRVVQIGSALAEQVTVADTGNVALETNAERYAFGQMFGRPQRDIDVVDLASGQRKRVLSGTRFGALPSPDGRRVAWFSSGQWRFTDLVTGATQAATTPAGSGFTDTEDDHPVPERGPWGNAGWSSDSRWFIAYDRYDVWRLAADGSRAERLTSGAAERRVHRVLRTEPFDQRGPLDLARPVYLQVAGEWSKENGIARLVPGQGVQLVASGAAAFSRLLRADSAATVAWVRERFDEPPNWYVATPGPAGAARRVSDLDPFQADYAWGRAELVEFRSDSGRVLQGVLYYPANHDPSRKYPMIVNTYELMSGAIHNYVPPSERSYYNRTVWTSRGYFVFTPDVVFRAGDPGRSYLECVIPAVRAVIAMGVVDSARIGLVGHSWGGYEAAYAPTQTNLFATSIAGAAITNFLSFPGAFHWTPGMPELDHWETGQARMGKAPWEDFEGHVRNSPAAFVDKLQRPMLMMFGDADGTVDWHQGVEFYNFARRAGKEDFVMLVYPGEDHGLRKKENQVDYHRRILEWFGHWLKGEPAPAWIRSGVAWQRAAAGAER